jgi:hypothetical protein
VEVPGPDTYQGREWSRMHHLDARWGGVLCEAVIQMCCACAPRSTQLLTERQVFRAKVPLHAWVEDGEVGWGGGLGMVRCKPVSKDTLTTGMTTPADMAISMDRWEW